MVWGVVSVFGGDPALRLTALGVAGRTPAARGIYGPHCAASDTENRPDLARCGADRPRSPGRSRAWTTGGRRHNFITCVAIRTFRGLLVRSRGRVIQNQLGAWFVGGASVRCAKCGTEGIPGKKFCAECGSPLSNRCSNCNSDNAAGAKFCADCGTTLTGDAAPAAASSPQAAAAASNIRVTPEQPDASTKLDGERKTVTALFADIKGSTELMRDLDPEEARAIVDPALKLMIDAVHRYDGYVVQSTGDGIFAVFGAPVAHEDHPQRALYAALRLQEEVKR